MFGEIRHNVLGIAVRQAPFPLEREVPKRIHRKRRGQSDAYHRRVQKKWTKRWGTKTESYALMIDPGAAGLRGNPFVLVDPRHMVLLKNFAI